MELKKWYQQEFEFTFDTPPARKPRRKRIPVDYDQLYQLFLKGPVTFHDIEVATGISHNGVAQVITTLSLKYPIWSPKRGVYKLYDEDDYNTRW